MKYVTFSGGGMLAGVANMLEQLGHNTTDREIAMGMEAPYLFVHEYGVYRAGAGLYQPPWINLYLLPHGFRLVQEEIEQSAVAAFLRSHSPAMLELQISGSNRHPVVFTGYEATRYQFINIKSVQSEEPDSFSLSSAMLKRRLDEKVTIYTLTACSPQAVDMISPLVTSLKNIDTYEEDILAARKEVVTRNQLKSMDTTLFRALMKDLRPMMLLIEQPAIAEELRFLHHDYRHIFTINDGESIAISERLPKYPIKTCLTWLREEILDRLYVLGVSEEVMSNLVDAYICKKK